jgi:hypothetical protein
MSAITGAAVRVGRVGRGLLPSGQLLTPEVWERRHRGIVWLLWLHVAGVAAFAVVRGPAVIHGAFVLATSVATWSTGGSASARRSRSAGWSAASRGWPAPTRSPACPTGGCGRSCPGSWNGPADRRRAARGHDRPGQTSRPTTTASATRPATCCSRRRPAPGGPRSAPPTCWPATAARSSWSCCRPAPWTTPSASSSDCGPSRPRLLIRPHRSPGIRARAPGGGA